MGPRRAGSSVAPPSAGSAAPGFAADRVSGRRDRPGTCSEPRRGDETTLLAAVAARHDADVDDVLDLLWPGEDDAVARRRLRNTLNRLRGSVGDVVVRRGDRLALDPDVSVDVHQVVQAARIGHTVPELGVEAARRALALVRGELANPGGDPVLDDLRDELSLAVGVLADRVSDAATTTGELGEAARWLATARRLDRYDEDARRPGWCRCCAPWAATPRRTTSCRTPSLPAASSACRRRRSSRGSRRADRPAVGLWARV